MPTSCATTRNPNASDSYCRRKSAGRQECPWPASRARQPRPSTASHPRPRYNGAVISSSHRSTVRRVRENSGDRLRRRIGIEPRHDAGSAAVMAKNAVVKGHPAKSEPATRDTPPSCRLPLHPASAGGRQGTMPVGAHSAPNADGSFPVSRTPVVPRRWQPTPPLLRRGRATAPGPGGAHLESGMQPQGWRGRRWRAGDVPRVQLPGQGFMSSMRKPGGTSNRSDDGSDRTMFVRR